jgi:hypothetical protein
MGDGDDGAEEAIDDLGGNEAGHANDGEDDDPPHEG